MDLVSCLVIPIRLYLFLYFIPEICFCFYIAIRIKLVEKIFVQFSFFKQAYLGDLNFKMFLTSSYIFFIQSKIIHDKIKFLIIKNFIQLHYHKIIDGLAHEFIPESFVEIFYQ